MSERRDGEYVCLYWDGDPTYEVVRGHVSAEVAIASVNNDTGAELGAGLEVEHRFARWGFAEEGSCYDRQFMLSPSGRGAFPVTLIHLYPKRSTPARESKLGSSSG